VRDVEADLLIK